MAKRIRRAWPWLTALLVILAAALLIAQAVAVYAAGNAPENLTEAGVHIHPVYSREIVLARLRAIGAPLWVCAAAAVVGLALGAGAGEPRPSVPPERQLGRLMARLPAALPEASADAALLHREARNRRRAWLACAVACLVALLFSAAYLLDPGHFTSWELEAVMGRMLLALIPWMGLAFGALCAAAFFHRASVRRAIPAARRLAAMGRVSPLPPPAKPERGRAALRLGLYVAAAALVVLGVLNGGLRDVLVKAINICTECIGLG